MLFVLTTLLYIGIRIDHASSIESPHFFPDSKVYLSIAESPVTFKNYATNKVPFVTPLAYRLVGAAPQNIAVFHTALSIIAWILLGLGVISLIKGKLLQWLSYSLALLFSLSAEILLFDWNILSESISLSLMVIFIACWMFFIANPRKKVAYSIPIVLIGFLWIFTRDTNSLLVLALSVVLITAASIRKNWHVTAIALLLFSFNMLSTQLGSLSERWIPPNLKLLETRLLEDEDSFNFYQANGMPVNAALFDMAGSQGKRIADWYENPELAEFLDWHRENGKQVYLKLLLSEPYETFLDPLRNAKKLVFSKQLFWYSPKGFDPVLPEALNEILFFPFWNAQLISATALLLVAATAIYIRRREQSLITPLLMILFLYPHALAVWTASGGDINRHSYQFRVHYRLALFLLAIYIFEYLLVEVFSKHFAAIVKAKKVFLYSGMLLSLLSLTADFIFETGDTYYLGFAQLALLVFGGLLVVLGFVLQRDPEKLRTSVVGKLGPSNDPH